VVVSKGVEHNLMDDNFFIIAAETLRVMGHPARIKIALLLSRGRFSVGEIARLCELPPNQTCEHLRLLQQHALLDSRKEGRTVFYYIDSPRLTGLLHCISDNCQRRV
jgi:ArsR family transcriptional regulator